MVYLSVMDKKWYADKDIREAAQRALADWRKKREKETSKKGSAGREQGGHGKPPVKED